MKGEGLIAPSLTVPFEEAPANYVPAAAVIRRGRALSGFIGRKELVGGLVSRVRNLHAQRGGATRYCHDSSPVEECGIPGVAVKCADIGRNTRSEGGTLGRN